MTIGQQGPIDARITRKIEDQKKQEELKKKNQDEYQKFRVALHAVCKDANGIIVLRHIAKISGFWQSSVVKKGDGVSMLGVDLEGTLVNEGRRGVYLDIRRPMTEEARRLIESKGDDHVVDNA